MTAAPVAPDCPFCGAPLAAAQIWCLECGVPARTRLAPTPRHWRLIAGVVLVASVLAIVVIAVAVAKFVRSESGPPPVTTIVSAAPAPTTPAPVTTVPAPATTTPAPLTTVPAQVTTTPASVTTVPAQVTTTPASVTTTRLK